MFVFIVLFDIFQRVLIVGGHTIFMKTINQSVFTSVFVKILVFDDQGSGASQILVFAIHKFDGVQKMFNESVSSTYKSGRTSWALAIFDLFSASSANHMTIFAKCHCILQGNVATLWTFEQVHGKSTCTATCGRRHCYFLKLCQQLNDHSCQFSVYIGILYAKRPQPCVRLPNKGCCTSWFLVRSIAFQ